jgi:SAM-dependent MidA family methyltransferase
VTPAAELLADEIRRDGPIPFRRFMEWRSTIPNTAITGAPDPFGKGGDFYTAEFSHFGILMAARIASSTAKWASPWTSPWWNAPTAENGRALSGGDTFRSRSIPARCRRNFCGVVFSNEFFDALPVEVAQRKARSGQRVVFDTPAPVAPADRFVRSGRGNAATLPRPRMAAGTKQT